MKRYQLNAGRCCGCNGQGGTPSGRGLQSLAVQGNTLTATLESGATLSVNLPTSAGASGEDVRVLDATGKHITTLLKGTV